MTEPMSPAALTKMARAMIRAFKREKVSIARVEVYNDGAVFFPGEPSDPTASLSETEKTFLERHNARLKARKPTGGTD